MRLTGLLRWRLDLRPKLPGWTLIPGWYQVTQSHWMAGESSQSISMLRVPHTGRYDLMSSGLWCFSHNGPARLCPQTQETLALSERKPHD